MLAKFELLWTAADGSGAGHRLGRLADVGAAAASNGSGGVSCSFDRAVLPVEVRPAKARRQRVAIDWPLRQESCLSGDTDKIPGGAHGTRPGDSPFIRSTGNFLSNADDLRELGGMPSGTRSFTVRRICIYRVIFAHLHSRPRVSCREKITVGDSR